MRKSNTRSNHRYCECKSRLEKVYDSDAHRWLWIRSSGSRVTYVRPVGGWRKGDKHDKF